MVDRLRASLRGIGGRIALLGIVSALVATLLTGASGIHAIIELRERQTHAALQSAVERTEAALTAAQNRMLAYATALEQQSLLRGWVAAGEAARVRTRLETTYGLLHARDPVIAVLEATDRAGRVLARGHNPGLAGDDKSGAVDVARALRGETVLGVTVSPSSGQLNFGATIPLRENNVVIGTLRIAGRFDGATARSISHQAGGEIALFAGGRLAVATMPGATAADMLPHLAPGSAARGAAGMAVDVAQAPYLMRALPLPDLTGTGDAVILLAVPLTDWQAAQWAAIVRALALGLAVILATLAISLLAAGRMARPLRGMADAMRRMSAGDLAVEIPGRGRPDEIGAMAGALEVFRDGLKAATQLATEADLIRRQRERRAAAVDGYTQDFGQSVAGVMRQLEGASEAMKEAAQTMSGAVSETQARASQTAGDASTASESLTAVAAAVEQMAASVAEISRQVARAAAIATEAVTEAAVSDERMQSMTRSADRIGDILGVISDVAGRTNLLALNATIEAARAGEAGRGFAVVAGEVKQLAAQTARATEDVGQQIQAMRQAADEAAGAMHGMTRTIARIDEVATTIAAAVEEQGASTREIAQRVQSVAGNTSGASRAMAEVFSVAAGAAQVCGDVQTAAGTVGEQATALRHEVETFLANLRADPQERRRFDRRPVQGHHLARLEIAGRTHELPIIDLSCNGAALHCQESLASGLSGVVTLPGAPPIQVRVARCHEGKLGLLFTQAECVDIVEKVMKTLCMQAA